MLYGPENKVDLDNKKLDEFKLILINTLVTSYCDITQLDSKIQSL